MMKIGLWHLIATNLVIWSTTVCTEAAEQFAHALVEKRELTSSSSEKSSKEVLNETYETSTSVMDQELFCLENDPLGAHIGPYLFPFVIEYALIAASIIYQIYTNLGNNTHKQGHMLTAHIKRITKVGSICHKANAGLFQGFIVLVTILVLTCIFLMLKEGQYLIHGSHIVEAQIYFGCNMALNVLGLFVVIIALTRTGKLHISAILEKTLDQNLLLIALCGYYFMMFFMAIASANHVNHDEQMDMTTLHISSNAVTFVQSTLQTVYILDAMRRHSISSDHVMSKPGRSMVSFLLVSNMALWLVNTFQLKELTFSKTMINFYGEFTWIITSQMFLPLAIFYRFHSVVCLAEIWSHAYRHHELEEHGTVNGTHIISHDIMPTGGY